MLSGDVPLISAETIAGLLEAHASSSAAATMLTIELDDPGSYGRVVRDAEGEVERVVEAKAAGDADGRAAGDPRDQRRHLRLRGGAARRGARGPLQRQRPGRVLPARRPAGAARGRPRGRRPPRRRPRGDDGGQQPCRPRRGRGRGAPPHPRGATCSPGSPSSIPASTWVDAGVEIAADARIEPGTSLRGETKVGAGTMVGPLSTLIDIRLGANVSVPHSYLVDCDVADDANVGPFAYLRPGAALDPGRQGRHLRRDQELTHRRGRQGPSPRLRRRRRGRRRQQPRRRHDHRQLRRFPQEPDCDRRERPHRR